jgi:hypothetical protein
MCPRCWWDTALKAVSDRIALRYSVSEKKLEDDELTKRIKDVNANVGTYETCLTCPIGAWCMTSFMKNS